MKDFKYLIIFILMIYSCFVLLFKAKAESDHKDGNVIQGTCIKLLFPGGIDVVPANFPFEAKKQILEALNENKKNVIAGFFYRDLNKNDFYDKGEEISATLLGKPEIESGIVSCKTYFNCYWFASVSQDKPVRIRYEHNGVEPFRAEIRPKSGLNILHIPIAPVKPLVYIIPHSHFDPEWVVTYEQGLKSEIPNIEQRLDLLQKEPAHCFYNDEECVTRPFVERAGQRHIEMLRQGISDGMIEPKGIITQGELTMPYGESIIRCITNGERMISDLLGEKIRPQVFSSIDQYGYSYQLPQILKKAGRPYFLEGEYIEFPQFPYSDPEIFNHPEYWLKGMDGSKILVYRELYARTPSFPDSKVKQRGTVKSHKSILNFYGTDFCPPNHDRDLVAYLDSLNSSNGPYKYIISPTNSLFRAIEKSPEIPTFTSEKLSKFYNGIYECRVEARIGNRRIENKILASESLATTACLKGMSYPKGIMDEAWFWLLVNQDHDPLMGPMGVPGLYEGSVLPRNETAESLINACLTSTLNWLATEITADQQPGIPVIVFNPVATRRSVIVQAHVPSALSSVNVADLHGKMVQSQTVNKSEIGTTVAFMAEDLPSLGWKTYYVSEKPEKNSGALLPGVLSSENLLENQYLRIEMKDGMIRKIIEKTSDTVIFEADDLAGINEVFIWKDEGCISVIKPLEKNDIPHFIGNPGVQILARSSKTNDRKVTLLETGPARGTIQTEFNLDCGNFLQKVSLDAGSRIIRFTTDVVWNSAGRISDFNGRRVRVAFNSAFKNAAVTCDIPFGVIDWEQSEKIRPVNSWLGIGDSKYGAAFFHHGPQSVQVVNDISYMTLFRSVISPKVVCGWDNPNLGDKATEDGQHSFKYEIYIYQGDWKEACVPIAAVGENIPVFIKMPDRRVKDKLLAGEESFISIKPATLVITAVKPTEYSDSGIIVRLFNPTGIPVNGTLALGFPHQEAIEVNFREEQIKNLLSEGSDYTLNMAPFEILTVLIQK